MMLDSTEIQFKKFSLKGWHEHIEFLTTSQVIKKKNVIKQEKKKKKTCKTVGYRSLCSYPIMHLDWRQNTGIFTFKLCEKTKQDKNVCDFTHTIPPNFVIPRGLSTLHVCLLFVCLYNWSFRVETRNDQTCIFFLRGGGRKHIFGEIFSAWKEGKIHFRYCSHKFQWVLYLELCRQMFVTCLWKF